MSIIYIVANIPGFTLIFSLLRNGKINASKKSSLYHAPKTKPPFKTGVIPFSIIGSRRLTSISLISNNKESEDSMNIVVQMTALLAITSIPPRTAKALTTIMLREKISSGVSVNTFIVIKSVYCRTISPVLWR